MLVRGCAGHTVGIQVGIHQLTQRDTNSPYPGTSLGTILGKTIDVLGTHRVGRKLSHLIRKFCPKETGTHRETESLPKFWEGA